VGRLPHVHAQDSEDGCHGYQQEFEIALTHSLQEPSGFEIALKHQRKLKDGAQQVEGGQQVQ
jgi:hypothetical protein